MRRAPLPKGGTADKFFNPGSRRPRLRAVTHFGVQAQALPVDECAIVWPGCRPTPVIQGEAMLSSFAVFELTKEPPRHDARQNHTSAN